MQNVHRCVALELPTMPWLQSHDHHAVGDRQVVFRLCSCAAAGKQLQYDVM